MFYYVSVEVPINTERVEQRIRCPGMSLNDELRVLYRNVFGDSDSDSNCASDCGDRQRLAVAECIDHAYCDEIPGLVHIKQFLPVETQLSTASNARLQYMLEQNDNMTWTHYTTDFQEELLRSIEKEGWFRSQDVNQVVKFGNLPKWVLNLIEKLPRSYWPPKVQARSPLFDQMFVNLYHPGDGICSHVDLMKFEDGIANVSLGGRTVLNFTQDSVKHKVLLEPGDLLLMSGEARYEWAHGIDAVTEEVFGTQLIKRTTRISLTLRKLCQQ